MLMSNFKQGVNSLLTDVEAEAVGAPIQACEQLQAGCEFFTDRCRGWSSWGSYSSIWATQVGCVFSTDSCRLRSSWGSQSSMWETSSRVWILYRQVQLLKQLGLLFKHMSNFKQGANSLQTDADSEAVRVPYSSTWAPISREWTLYRQMQTLKKLGLLSLQMWILCK